MAIFGLPTLAFILFLVAFIAGLAFIPLVAWTVGPMLPYFISEALANLLFVLSNLGVPTAVLEQQETDEYEFKHVDEDYEPQSYWNRWAGTRFGLTFEATEEAFEPTLIDDDHARELEHLEYTDDNATVDMDRGKNQAWFAHKSDIGKILVPIGQKLAELRDGAGPDIGIQAYAEALKDYGGDTSEYSNKTMIVGSFMFVGMGIMMGWIIFF